MDRIEGSHPPFRPGFDSRYRNYPHNSVGRVHSYQVAVEGPNPSVDINVNDRVVKVTDLRPVGASCVGSIPTSRIGCKKHPTFIAQLAEQFSYQKPAAGSNPAESILCLTFPSGK